MIVSTDARSPAPRWLRAATWVAVLCALPFGLIYCDRSEAPTEADEEAATELAVPDAPQELSEPAESDTEAILATRESVDRKRLPGGIAMRDSLAQRELVQSALSEHVELLLRATRHLERFHPIAKRPAPPIIRRPLPLLPKRPPGGASQTATVI